MKYLILLTFIVSFKLSASEVVFQINYLQGTSKAEEFVLTSKVGRKFELTKTAQHKSSKAELAFETGKRLSELVTKLAFSDKKLTPCQVYLSFTFDGQQGQICQQERERTRDAMQLMHHLDTFF